MGMKSADGAVAEALIQAMDEAEIAPKRVAIEAGISPTTMGRKLRAHSSFTIGELFAIAGVLHVDLSDLLPSPDSSDVIGGRS
jgi:transcriptional regulator with XRE-family HTH domain